METVTPAPAGADELTDRVRNALAERLPGVSTESVVESPFSGLFGVAYDGGVLYVSEDGRYVLSGKLIDLDTREDLTERTRARQRLRALAEIPESRMIVFGAVGQAKHTITTDRPARELVNALGRHRGYVVIVDQVEPVLG